VTQNRRYVVNVQRRPWLSRNENNEKRRRHLQEAVKESPVQVIGKERHTKVSDTYHEKKGEVNKLIQQSWGTDYNLQS